jgi:hypothetical protein
VLSSAREDDAVTSNARRPPSRARLVPSLAAALAAACSGGGGSPAATTTAATACTAGGVPGTCVAAAACAGAQTGAAGICDGGRVCCTPALAVACDPAAHPLPNAGLAEAAGAGGCPAGMVALSAALCIDRYEASLVAVADGASLSPYWNPGTTPARAVSIAGAVPQAYVSGTQAAAACVAAGKRLCTDAEWLRACRGAAGTDLWPYGAARVDGACNDLRPANPLAVLFGTTDAWIWSYTSHPCIDQVPASVARTGSFAGCTTAEGVTDLAGNLNEWTADPGGTLRGGSFVMGSLDGEGCESATTAHDASFRDFSTGFRCCADLL